MYKLTIIKRQFNKIRMVILRASVRSQKVREEIYFIAEKLLEKGYTKLVKRLP
jgi:hypothetical protein